MQETTNLKLPIYELDDMANLDDGYNNAMRKIDEFAGGVDTKFPIGSSDIEDGGVNTVDIANGAITENKLDTASVTTNKIATAAVTNDKLEDDSVTGAKIADGTIDLAKLTANSIDNTPTENSDNLVTSGGVYDYVKSEIDNIPVPENVYNLGWIGDSYSEESTLQLYWCEIVANNLHATKFINNSISGSGYVGSASRTFLSQLQMLNTTLPDATEIVIFGGANDYKKTSATLEPAINTFWNTYKQLYGNTKAHVFLGNPMGDTYNSIKQYNNLVITALKNNNINYALHDVAGLQFSQQGYISQTNLHPTSEMCLVYANAFTSLINGGDLNAIPNKRLYTNNSQLVSQTNSDVYIEFTKDFDVIGIACNITAPNDIGPNNGLNLVTNFVILGAANVISFNGLSTTHTGFSHFIRNNIFSCYNNGEQISQGTSLFLTTIMGKCC